MLVRALAALLDPLGEDLTQYIDHMVSVDPRAVWAPTAESIFKRMSSASLDQLWQQQTGLAASHPSITSFGRLKKGKKAERLEALFASDEVCDALGMGDKQATNLARWWPDTAT